MSTEHCSLTTKFHTGVTVVKDTMKHLPIYVYTWMHTHRYMHAHACTHIHTPASTQSVGPIWDIIHHFRSWYVCMIKSFKFILIFSYSTHAHIHAQTHTFHCIFVDMISHDFVGCVINLGCRKNPWLMYELPFFQELSMILWQGEVGALEVNQGRSILTVALKMMRYRQMVVANMLRSCTQQTLIMYVLSIYKLTLNDYWALA